MSLNKDLPGNSDLNCEIEKVKNQIRNNPADADLRFHLFQLLYFSGNLSKAADQLSIASEMNSSTYGIYGKICHTFLETESLREKVFAGQVSPLIFGEPQPWVIHLIQALKAEQEQQHDIAASLRAQASNEAPACKGSFNGENFDWIADTDCRLGPMIEALVDGKYYWIPINNLIRITAEKPSHLIDTLWFPATFVWKNDGSSQGYIPALYVNSSQQDDSNIKTGKLTTWEKTPSGEDEIAFGQKMLYTEKEDLPLLGLRNLTMESHG